MNTPTDFSRLLSRSAQCAIIGHVNPDGDAMGAALALRRYIAENYPNIIVRAVLPNRFPAYFAWMDNAANILIYSENKDATTAFLQQCNLIICVDFNAIYRLDELGKIVAALTATKVLIDHHPQPAPDFNLQFSDSSACSTCEVLHGILTAISPAPISAAIAESLYTGIFTDTGGFAFNIKRPSVFRIAADLMETGIDKDAIAARIFDSYSPHRMRLMGYALKDKMVVMDDCRAAYIALSKDELTDYRFETGDTEGFANLPLSIKGIALSGFFYENADGSHIRVSLRSRGNAVSVNDIAREHFGGGGHHNAAGGKFFGKLDGCCRYFENIVQKLTLLLCLFCACSNVEIKPHKPAPSLEKQMLMQANISRSQREYDSISAFIRRSGLALEANAGGYFLHIAKHGSGAAITNGSIVRLAAQIRLLDSTLCYDYTADQPLEVAVGKEAMLSGFHAALLGMQAGTEATLILSSYLAFGLLGDRKCVPPQSPLVCRITIIGVE